MSDLISRQAAIDAIENTDWYHQNASKEMVSGANPDTHQAWYKADDVYNALESVPSAQSSDDYERGWEDGRKALREEIREDDRDRLD